MKDLPQGKIFFATYNFSIPKQAKETKIISCHLTYYFSAPVDTTGTAFDILRFIIN
jgi:hypothetical protein